MQSDTDDLVSLFNSVKYSAGSSSHAERIERFREATKTLEAAALQEIFKWYYTYTESAVTLLERSILDSNATSDLLFRCLCVAYKSCDLLRFHVECASARFLTPEVDLPFTHRNMYMTRAEWQDMMARCNTLCKRQRDVEKKLNECGIWLDVDIVGTLSQHRPLV